MNVNRVINSSIEGIVHSKSVLFTETAAGTSFTGTITVPAGSVILDIVIVPIALWTGTTSANLKVGDAADDDGYFTNVDLKATDLILGERLQAASDNFWGGKNGAYLTTAGRFGTQTDPGLGGYFSLSGATAGSVIGIVTRVGTTGAAGRTLMTVTYAPLYEIAAATAA